MSNSTTQPTPSKPDGLAPDGSEIRLLAELASCGMAEFRLPAGCTWLSSIERLKRSDM